MKNDTETSTQVIMLGESRPMRLGSTAGRRLDAVRRQGPTPQDGAPASVTRRMKVTPKLAAQWLANNHCNRPRRPARVTYLARQMKRGFWHINGHAIGLDCQGRLIAGQHRLAAVIESGCTVEMDVAFNLPDAAGASGNDVAGGGTMRPMKYRTSITAMMNTVHWLTTGDKDTALSPREMEEMIEEHGEVLDLALRAFPRAKGRMRRSPIWGALLVGLHSHRPETLAFIEAIVGGEGLRRGDPAYQLRESTLPPKTKKADRELAVKTLTAVMHRIGLARGSKTKTALQPAPVATRNFFPLAAGVPDKLD